MTDLHFDTTIRPQDDFFGYVNNDWLRNHPIPASESSWGTFYELRDQSANAVKSIMNRLLASDDKDLNTDEKLLKSFYKTGVEYNSHSSAHLKSLEKIYAQIDALSSPKELALYLGNMHRHDQNAFWSLYIDMDDKNSSVHVMRIHQSGLTLPNRDYYIENSDHMSHIREKYSEYAERLFSAIPSLVIDNWQAIYELEKQLAEAAWTNVELRDIEKNYNRFTINQLKQTYDFDWDAYFDGLQWQKPNDNIVVGQPAYIAKVMEILSTAGHDTVKSYLKWRALMLVVSWLNEETAAITFDLFGVEINGMREMKPVWKRMVLLTDALVIGEAVGKLYAAEHFPETSKQSVLSIVEDVRHSYHARIDKLTWMSHDTKERAHKKLDNISVFIGYPSVWKDFATLSFSSSNHIDNILKARAFWSALELKKVGKKPAAEEWEMNAHTVNAYHHPNRLEIVFPAAILQPPFYDASASYATNLGGIGAVIGHEFTHGFDDQGADFDEYGNTNRWQTKQERAAFDVLAAHIVAQADAFETVPGVFLQGKLILGEAIADIGGLELAIETLKDKNSDSLRELLINFARCECGHATKERLIELAKVDPHPPSPFRVNAVVGHVDAFYETYGLTDTDGLYIEPVKRAYIW